MKIVIIGAGIGGLQAAKAFADGGAEVCVFERKQREEIAYDWIDDVETKVFTELGIELPEGYFHTANVTFGIPFSEKKLRVELPEEKLDWSIERKLLAEVLVKRALAASSRIEFGTAVDSLNIENEKVNGVTVNGAYIAADLVVDGSGVRSPFRAMLPKRFHVTAQPKNEELIYVYRGFFAPAPNVEPPKLHTKQIFLKHLGEMGISWCIVEPNGDVNVLIGRIGGLSDETLENALKELKKDNPIIGDKLLRGGGKYEIPVRYPLTAMVADGYAAVGDSAFMTIPMIGSGIANSLRAGQLLADTVLTAKAYDAKTLWKYQYEYFVKIGAGHANVDLMKRMLLGMDAQDIRFLFESGIIGEREMTAIGAGEQLTMSFGQIMDKLKRGISKLGLLITLVKTISKGQKAEKTAASIPVEYSERELSPWQSKLEGFYE